jgi:hypothetical protein
MGLFRIFRPITVDARQCTRAETIVTDLGFTNATPGDWIIRGEGGESYILNNKFFRRTFAPVEESPVSHDERDASEQTRTVSSTIYSNSLVPVAQRLSSHSVGAETQPLDALSPWRARTRSRRPKIVSSAFNVRQSRKADQSI